MKNQTMLKLPFWETLGRSFKYVLKNNRLLKAILPIIGGLILLQILLGIPFSCAFGAGKCSIDWRYYLSLTSLYVAAAGIIINYCRSIVCKANVEFLTRKFCLQMGLYLLAKLFMLAIILVPVILVVWIISYLSNFNEIVIFVTLVLVPLIFSILFSSLFLMFPAIAVEDYEMTKIKKLFEITKGNYNKIFWGQFALSIPYWILFKMCIELYQIININTYVLNLFFVIISMGLAMIDACFKGAYFAHIYQFFKFYDKK